MSLLKLQGRPNRPSAVTRAVWLLLLGLALEVTASVLWAPPDQTEIISMLIRLALTLSIARGRNWARLMFAILFVCGIPFIVMDINRILATEPQWVINMVVQAGLQIVALVGLFSRAASAWFRQRLAASPATSAT